MTILLHTFAFEFPIKSLMQETRRAIRINMRSMTTECKNWHEQELPFILRSVWSTKNRTHDHPIHSSDTMQSPFNFSHYVRMDDNQFHQKNFFFSNHKSIPSHQFVLFDFKRFGIYYHIYLPRHRPVEGLYISAFGCPLSFYRHNIFPHDQCIYLN